MYVGRKRIYADRRGFSKSRSKSKRKQYKKQPITFPTTIARPLGNKQIGHFRYADYQSIAGAGGGAAAVWVLSGNGLYDPDITGIGHQPSGFDELMAIYDHYTVLWSKVHVTFINTTTGPAQSGVVGISVMDNATALGDYREYIEAGESCWSSIDENGRTNDFVVKKQMGSVKRNLGRPKPLDEDDLRGTSAANPTEQYYFHIWNAPNSAGSLATDIMYVVDFYAVLTEPRVVGLS